MGNIIKKVTAHVYRLTWAKNMTLNGCDHLLFKRWAVGAIYEQCEDTFRWIQMTCVRYMIAIYL